MDHWPHDGIGTRRQSRRFFPEQLLFPHQHKTRWRKDPLCSVLYHHFAPDQSPKDWKVRLLYESSRRWKQVPSSSRKAFLQRLKTQDHRDIRHSRSSCPGNASQNLSMFTTLRQTTKILRGFPKIATETYWPKARMKEKIRLLLTTNKTISSSAWNGDIISCCRRDFSVTPKCQIKNSFQVQQFQEMLFEFIIYRRSKYVTINCEPLQWQQVPSQYYIWLRLSTCRTRILLVSPIGFTRMCWDKNHTWLK